MKSIEKIVIAIVITVKYLVMIVHNISFYCIFDQINE